jgi:cytochrome c oxidase subunit 3
MTQSAQAAMAGAPLLDGTPGVIADWSSDQRAFKKTPWGKVMMWIFLLSDTFIFSCFLIAYGTVRMSTTIPWPNPSEVFALNIGGNHIPLLLIAIMTFVLITSSVLAFCRSGLGIHICSLLSLVGKS